MAKVNNLRPFNLESEHFKKLMLREIPERDAEVLRSVCGLRNVPEGADTGEIAREVREAYWQWKLIRDRIDVSAFTTQDYVMIAYIAGQHHVKWVDMIQENIIEKWHNQEVKYGTPVVFRFRGVEEYGILAGLANNKKSVLVNFNGEEREVSPDDVWVDTRKRNGEPKPSKPSPKLRTAISK